MYDGSTGTSIGLLARQQENTYLALLSLASSLLATVAEQATVARERFLARVRIAFPLISRIFDLCD